MQQQRATLGLLLYEVSVCLLERHCLRNAWNPVQMLCNLHPCERLLDPLLR